MSSNTSTNVTSTFDPPIDHTTTSWALVCVLLILCACSSFAAKTSKRRHKVTTI
ncbi:hypothetical protein N9A45_00780 [bacterium]|nr:hypothetical protein [bacterium]